MVDDLTHDKEDAMIQEGLFDELIFDEHADEMLLRQIYGVTPVQIRMMKMGLRFGYVSRQDVLSYLKTPRRGLERVYRKRIMLTRSPAA